MTGKGPSRGLGTRLPPNPYFYFIIKLIEKLKIIINITYYI